MSCNKECAEIPAIISKIIIPKLYMSNSFDTICIVTNSGGRYLLHDIVVI